MGSDINLKVYSLIQEARPYLRGKLWGVSHDGIDWKEVARQVDIVSSWCDDEVAPTLDDIRDISFGPYLAKHGPEENNPGLNALFQIQSLLSDWVVEDTLEQEFEQFLPLLHGSAKAGK